MSVLKIEGMTCGGCVNSVTNAIKRAAPAAEVEVDLESATASIGGEADMAVVAAAIEKAGFTVAGEAPAG